MSLKLITAPVNEPVGLAEAKSHMRIDHGDDDTLIEALIRVARQEAEKITRRALITQTWELILDCFPCGGIDIPLPVLQSVTDIKYFDASDTEQTLDAATYQVDTDSTTGRIALAYGASWPSTMSGKLNAVRIRYVAGYGTETTDVPQAIQQWIMIRVATLYENREATTPVKLEATPFIDGLLDEYRVLSF